MLPGSECICLLMQLAIFSAHFPENPGQMWGTRCEVEQKESPSIPPPAPVTMEVLNVSRVVQ